MSAFSKWCDACGGYVRFDSRVGHRCRHTVTITKKIGPRRRYKMEEEKTMSTKETNPKDAVGTKKWRQYCTVPTTIIWELGVAMLEGARKYGRHNYRVAGVRASVYIDAAKGHIDQWWEGEDIDAESGLSHITKAMASLAVLRDAMINDMVNDDRPPKCNLDHVRNEMQKAVEDIFERFPDAVDPFTQIKLEDAAEHEALESSFLEHRLADPDDDTVLTKQKARDLSVGFDDYCKETEVMVKVSEAKRRMDTEIERRRAKIAKEDDDQGSIYSSRYKADVME